MLRGMILGLFVGGGLSVLGAALISTVMPLPKKPEFSADIAHGGDIPDAGTPGVNPLSGAGSEDRKRAAPGTGAPVQVQTQNPDIDTTGGLDGDVTETAARPLTLDGTDGVAAPDSPADGGDVQISATEPVLPNPQAALPKQPDIERDVSVSTETAPLPVAAQPEPEPEAEPAVAPASDPETEAAPAPQDTAPDVQTALLQPETPASADGDDALVEPLAIPRDGDAEQPGAATEDNTSGGDNAAVEISRAPAQPAAPEPEAPATASEDPAGLPETEPAARTTALPQSNATTDAPAAGPAIGRPATNLLNRAGSQTTRRLPGIGSDGGEQETATQNGATDNTTEAASSGDPISKNSVAFENPDSKPMMSIVLLDTGQDLTSGPVGLSALGSFPSALTFAVDTNLPDAADRAARYRAQGMEVMALIDLPPNLTAADTEVALAAALSAVPEAVGVMEGVGDGLQGNRQMSDQVTEILAAEGLGIVWQPKGLDTASKLALRDGLPSQTLFRDFDSADQTPTVIRRFLDNAAFRAGQEGGVIMLGRVRPDTISALLLWGLQDRASRVAVAPVSAVLQKAAADNGG